MNVKGRLNDEEIKLQVNNQNEELHDISQKYKDALKYGPSLQLETELKKIIDEIAYKDSGFDKILTFQCEYEIAKSLMIRGEYTDSVNHLLRTLTLEPDRVSCWMTLLTCAQKLNNTTLYGSALAVLKKLRSDLHIEENRPLLTDLPPRMTYAEFKGHVLPNQCWKLYLQILSYMMKQNSNTILEFTFDQYSATSEICSQRNLYRPDHIDKDTHAIQKSKIYYIIGGMDIPSLLLSIGSEKISSSTYLTPFPVYILVLKTLERIACATYSELIPRDVSVVLFQIASIPRVFNELSPFCKLFIGELVISIDPHSIAKYIDNIPIVSFSSQLVCRVLFCKLSSAITQNRKYDELTKLLDNCTKHLDNNIIHVKHAGYAISQKTLNEKREQINILEAVSKELTEELSTEQALRYFSNNMDLLRFLSLSNTVKLFLKINEQDAKLCLHQFLRYLPDSILKNKSETPNLIPFFETLTYELPDELIDYLITIFYIICDIEGTDQLKFSVALAIAYGSSNKQRKSDLNKIHKKLDCICHLQGGKFLELILKSLLIAKQAGESVETQLKNAFGCYFSNASISKYSHGSKLVVRCSPYLQPYYEFLSELDQKDDKSINLLFQPFLEFWIHNKECKCGCLKNLDGNLFYRIFKKKKNQILKSKSIKQEWDLIYIFEDLLSFGDGKDTDINIGIAKLYLKQYYELYQKYFYSTSAYPTLPDENEVNEKLDRAFQHLENCSNNTDYLWLLKAICFAIRNKNQESINLLMNIRPFDKVNREVRRLYWVLRVFSDTGNTQSPVFQRALNDVDFLIPKLSSSQNDLACILSTLKAKILNDKELIQRVLSTYSRVNRLNYPYPYIELANRQDDEDAYKTLFKIVKVRCLTVYQFYHFDYKMPYAFAKPLDIEDIRRDILSRFIKAALNSGNYTQLFSLFSPNNKLNGRLCRVLQVPENRIMFGNDMLKLFKDYTRCLIDDINSLIAAKKNVRKEYLDRSYDAIEKARQLEDPEATQLANELKIVTFKYKNHGKEPPTEVTMEALFNVAGGEEEEEEEDEEDGEFNVEGEDGDDDSSDKDGAYRDGANNNDDEEEEPEFEEEENEEVAEEDLEGEGEEED